MEITCDMAKDLADIYVSGNASAETARAVEEHLGGCDECRVYYEKRKERTAPHFRVETSGVASELIEDNLKKLSKRLRVRRIIGAVCASAAAVVGISAVLYDLISDYRKNEK